MPIFIKYLSLGIIFCILSPLPLIMAALFSRKEVLIVSMTALLLCIVAAGVYMIVRVATVKSGYQILLQEAEYEKSEKQKNEAVDAASSIYWCLVTGGYLAWSFITGDWGSTWIVWPVAGVLFVPFITVVKHLCGKED